MNARMNYMIERNHAICDRMMKKMIFEHSSVTPKVALDWALAAKNSLENYQGFSPCQIVFGQNPQLPSVYRSGPPGLEEVTMSQAVANQINAMHLAREAFIECESDRVIKTVLKKRLYTKSADVHIGEWIYFKNKRKWEGPVKILTKDGKLLYSVKAGKLITINSDHSCNVIHGSRIQKVNDESQSKDDVGLMGNENNTVNSSPIESDTVNFGPPENHTVNSDPPENHSVNSGPLENNTVNANLLASSTDVSNPTSKGNSRRSTKCPSKLKGEKEKWCRPCTQKKKCVGSIDVINGGIQPAKVVENENLLDSLSPAGKSTIPPNHVSASERLLDD